MLDSDFIEHCGLIAKHVASSPSILGDFVKRGIETHLANNNAALQGGGWRYRDTGRS
jgi:hypothetical protein